MSLKDPANKLHHSYTNYPEIYPIIRIWSIADCVKMSVLRSANNFCDPPPPRTQSFYFLNQRTKFMLDIINQIRSCHVHAYI